MKQSCWRTGVAIVAVLCTLSWPYCAYGVNVKEKTTKQPHESTNDFQRLAEEEEKKKSHHRSYKTVNEYMKRLASSMDLDEQENDNDTSLEEYDGSVMDIMMGVFSKAFDVRRPRDALYGSFSALSNLGKTYFSVWSVTLGYAIEGMYLDGVRGLLLDTPVALFSAALVGTAGLTASLYQLAMGVVMTPKAFWAMQQGKVWDEKSEDYVDYVAYSLDAEALEVDRLLEIEGLDTPKRGGESPQLRRGSNVRVKDSSYYNLLKVPSDASRSEIKKAYYREALNVHPDQKRSDPDAEAKFNQLHFVYTTLMKDETREAYNVNGAVCYEKGFQSQMESRQEVDPHVFFATMFGSTLVEPYVGRLAIGSLLDNLFEPTEQGRAFLQENKYVPDTLQQRKREIDIALNLRRRTADVVAGKQSLDAFRASCQVEAETIVQGDFGDVFLTLIGSVLKSEAKKFLGHKNSVFGLKGRAFVVQDKVYDVFLDLQMMLEKRSILSSIKSRRKEKKKKMMEEPTDGSNHTEECGFFEDEVDDALLQREASKLFKLGWSFNHRDITSTLRGACEKLFNDQFAPEQSRIQAEAVLTIGYEFVSAGRASGVAEPLSDEMITEKAHRSAVMSSIMID